jgi:hypothetical protein
MTISSVVSFIGLNYKVLFYKFVNSLWKNPYKNVVYLSNALNYEPHLEEKILELLLQIRGEILTSMMFSIMLRVVVVNE